MLEVNLICRHAVAEVGRRQEAGGRGAGGRQSPGNIRAADVSGVRKVFTSANIIEQMSWGVKGVRIGEWQQGPPSLPALVKLSRMEKPPLHRSAPRPLPPGGGLRQGASQGTAAGA